MSRQRDPRQARAVAALLSHRSIARAARSAGVHERTLRGWLRTDEAFAAAVRAARVELTRHTAARLARASSVSVSKLLRLLKTSKEEVAARVGLGLIAASHRAQELVDLEERVARLEAAAKDGPEVPGSPRTGAASA